MLSTASLLRQFRQRLVIEIIPGLPTHPGYERTLPGDSTPPPRPRPRPGKSQARSAEAQTVKGGPKGRGYMRGRTKGSYQVQARDDHGNRSVVHYRALVLRPAAASPGLARKVVLRWLLDLGMEEQAEKVLLIASELVANAVVHAHTVLEISMSTSSRSVELGVRDDDRHLPRLDSVDVPTARGGDRAPPLAEGGRGLAIVEGLADEWGVDVLRGGKRVWARISLTQ